MTIKLTTQQIIYAIENQRYPSWAWEETIETCTGLREEEMADAVASARFLEKFQPEEKWTANDFRRLLTHHLIGRWYSLADYGVVRAREEFEDGNLTERRLKEILDSKVEAATYGAHEAGTHVFTDTTGEVLIFTKLFYRHDLAMTDD